MPEDLPPDAEPATPPSRLEALTLRGQELTTRLEHERPRHASVDVGFRWFFRDREIAGGVLGGGLAFRFFFWVLSIALLVSGGLGIAGHAGDDVHHAVSDTGLSDAVANTVASAAQQSEADRWWLIAIGAWTFVWFSFSLLRAVRLVHAAAWRTPLPKFTNAPKALAVVLLAPIVAVAAMTAAGWVRASTSDLPGLVATLLVGVVFAAVWLVLSRSLPSAAQLPLSAYVPGAVVFGAGLEALHVFTVYFLSERLAQASALYGSLGIAGTALFYLYLIGRGLVWSAELNAVVWDVRSERREPPGDQPGEMLTSGISPYR